MNPLRVQIEQAVTAIREKTALVPQVGLILGSGLGELANAVTEATEIPYDQVPYVAASTVAGHAGRFLLGQLAGRPVVVMQGRVHFYEGYTMAQTTFPVRIIQGLGAETLIVTNAAGGLDPSFQVGDIMGITDHINLLSMGGQNPLWGPNDEALGPRFVEMRDAYNPALLALADDVAQDLGFTLRRGVYAQLSGPSFETPAEIRFLRSIGVAAVGMSTAAEVIIARHGDMRVLGLSHISNVAVAESTPTDEPAPADPHQEVLAAGRRAIPQLVALIQGILERMAV